VQSGSTMASLVGRAESTGTLAGRREDSGRQFQFSPQLVGKAQLQKTHKRVRGFWSKKKGQDPLEQTLWNPKSANL